MQFFFKQKSRKQHENALILILNIKGIILKEGEKEWEEKKKKMRIAEEVVGFSLTSRFHPSLCLERLSPATKTTPRVTHTLFPRYYISPFEFLLFVSVFVLLLSLTCGSAYVRVCSCACGVCE